MMKLKIWFLHNLNNKIARVCYLCAALRNFILQVTSANYKCMCGERASGSDIRCYQAIILSRWSLPCLCTLAKILNFPEAWFENFLLVSTSRYTLCVIVVFFGLSQITLYLSYFFCSVFSELAIVLYQFFSLSPRCLPYVVLPIVTERLPPDSTFFISRFCWIHRVYSRLRSVLRTKSFKLISRLYTSLSRNILKLWMRFKIAIVCEITMMMIVKLLYASIVLSVRGQFGLYSPVYSFKHTIVCKTRCWDSS